MSAPRAAGARTSAGSARDRSIISSRRDSRAFAFCSIPMISACRSTSAGRRSCRLFDEPHHKRHIDGVLHEDYRRFYQFGRVNGWAEAHGRSGSRSPTGSASATAPSACARASAARRRPLRLRRRGMAARPRSSRAWPSPARTGHTAASRSRRTTPAVSSIRAANWCAAMATAGATRSSTGRVSTSAWCRVR